MKTKKCCTYNFYAHSVKPDVKSVVIFLILLNKVDEIDNRCKHRKLRPCKGSVTLRHCIRRGARRHGDVVNYSHQVLSELHFFSLFIFLRPWRFPISFDLPVTLTRVVLNLIKVIPVGIAYIYAVMRCHKVRDNSGRNCVHLRNNPLRWDAIKLATRATVFTRHL